MHRKGDFAFRTYSVILLGILGAAAGLAIFFYGSPSGAESRAFLRSPEFVTWLFLNELLFALYPIMLALLWPRFRQGKAYLRRHWPEILFSSSILLALYLFPLLIAAPMVWIRPLPFEYSQTKIYVIETIGFLFSALPLTISIWLIQIAARQAFWEEPTEADDLPSYIGWRDDLKRFLMFYAVLLSLFIFASAAMRTAGIAVEAVKLEQYPTILLLLFGVLYSLVIALIYLPAYSTLLGAGNRLLNAFYPLPTPGSETWNKTFARRKELEDFLELKVSAEQRLATIITLLAPFVSSILSLLVKK